MTSAVVDEITRKGMHDSYEIVGRFSNTAVL